MKNKRIAVSFFLIVLLIIVLPVTVLAEPVGYIDVKVTVPEGFDKSIMINFFSESGANYLTTAEPVNSWQSNFAAPVGKYITDFVGIDNDPKREYIAEYTEEMEVIEGKGTLYEVIVKLRGDDRSVTVSDNPALQKMQESYEKQITDRSVEDSPAAKSGVIGQIKQYAISLIAAAIILVLWAILKIRKSKAQ